MRVHTCVYASVRVCVCVYIYIYIYIYIYTAVSSGCHNKFPHIECLKTTEIYAHSFEGQKSKIKTVFLEGAGETVLPCLFQHLAASGKPWLAALSLHSLPPLESVSNSLCLPLGMTQVSGPV